MQFLIGKEEKKIGSSKAFFIIKITEFDSSVFIRFDHEGTWTGNFVHIFVNNEPIFRIDGTSMSSNFVSSYLFASFRGLTMFSSIINESFDVCNSKKRKTIILYKKGKSVKTYNCLSFI